VLDPDLFRSVMGRFPSGITVVTARDAAGRDHGMTVSSFCSLSLVPPLVLICVERTTELHAVIGAADSFAVNVLAGDQELISRRFAEPDSGRFEGLAFTRGVTGCALLAGTLAHLECTVRARYDGGDHTIVTGEVIAAAAHDGRPLLYYRGGYSPMER
jgi:flavin reductase (DIM6/NTAB) family NADH-FMN oxidoreductase RutF